MRRHALRHIDHIDDGCKIMDRVVRQLGEHAGVDGERGLNQQQRVAVRRRLRHGIGAQNTARPGAILDHELLFEGFSEFLRQHARENIAGAAGGGGGDYSHRAGGVGLCQGIVRGQRRECGEQQCVGCMGVHWLPRGYRNVASTMVFSIAAMR